MVEHVIQVETETKVIHAAIAIALDLQRPQVGTVLKKLCACDHNHHSHCICGGWITRESLIEDPAKERTVVLSALKSLCADIETLRFFHRLHQRIPLDMLEITLFKQHLTASQIQGRDRKRSFGQV